jgi:hypothetical protein
MAGNGQLMDWQCFQAVVIGLTKIGEKKKVTKFEPF